MSFYDLARMTRLGTEDEFTRLTLSQERGLAKDPLVLTYFYLLLTGRTPVAKKKAYGLMVSFRPWTFWQILESTANDMGLNAERSQARSR